MAQGWLACGVEVGGAAHSSGRAKLADARTLCRTWTPLPLGSSGVRGEPLTPLLAITPANERCVVTYAPLRAAEMTNQLVAHHPSALTSVKVHHDVGKAEQNQ